MRKPLLIISSAIAVIAICTSSIKSTKQSNKLDRVTNSDGNNIGLNGSSSGVSVAQTGCYGSGCHGTKAAAATIVTSVLSGLPVNNQVVAGQTYTLSLVISNVAAKPTAKNWGFDIFSTDGSFATTNPNAEVDTNWSSNGFVGNGFPGAEIHHGSTAPAYTATVAKPSYTFDKITWTAPATPGLDTFYYAGNAANKNASADAKDYTTSSGPIILTVTASTTPVTLASFNAIATGSKVSLSWATATEINTDHFELERSIDGRNFKVTGTQKAKGTSSTILNYTYSDDVSALSGTVYYRLKSVDKNGAFNYSAIKAVTVKATKNLITSIYPNPVKVGGNLKFGYQSTQTGTITVSILNNAGKKVYSTSTSVNEGVNALSASTGNLSAGIYHLSVSNGNGTIVKTVVIQ